MAYKPFKMKASGYGNSPMKKNFPSAFKKDPPGSKKTKVFGGRGTLDTSTQKGKDILKEIKSIPTTSSSDKSRISKTPKFDPTRTMGKITSINYDRVEEGKRQARYKEIAGKFKGKAGKIAKGLGKIAGKSLMGGIVDPTNKTSPRLSDRKQFKQKFNTNSKKIY